MRKYGIPTAACEIFDELDAALRYLKTRPCPIVVKADGLALGKGVVICEDHAGAEAAVTAMLRDGLFGESGRRVVIEAFLTGPEVSVLAFCDGTTLVPMVSSMDHKRALDGDRGPNTGGMGAVAPNPFYTAEIAVRCEREIFAPTLRAMAAEGHPFKGCLYFGLMLTPEGPRVIEYNCRFGDPETQAVLPLLQSDLLEILLACTEGRLKPELVRFAPGHAACVVLASGGYPGPYAAGVPIHGLREAAGQKNIRLYCAGVAENDGAPVTAGGRVLGLTATAPTLKAAIDGAYAAAGLVHFAGMHFRRDIGRRALEA
jgi:phosphoribosylamine--glycine ligase